MADKFDIDDDGVLTSSDEEGPSGGSRGGQSRHHGGYSGGGRRRRQSCPFLKDGKCHINYKDVETLKLFITEEGKIRPRRQTNVCSKCQRALAIAVKRARHLALLPYAAQHTYGD